MTIITMDNSITINIEIQHGKPVLKGARIPVAVIIGSLAGSMSYEEVIQEYGITQEQILTSLAYFSELLNYETIYSKGYNTIQVKTCGLIGMKDPDLFLASK